MSNFSPHKNTFLSIEISQYWLYVNTPAQILWRISKPGRLSWTCPWYSFENLHAPTSPLKRRPLLLASLRKPEKIWKTNYLYVHGYILAAIFLKKTASKLVYQYFSKSKIESHSNASVLCLHRPDIQWKTNWSTCTWIYHWQLI